jgi:hypothetical protein
MTDTTEALRLAREALESCTPGDYTTGHVIHPWHDEAKVDAALAAIDAALSHPETRQPEPVPVVLWQYRWTNPENYPAQDESALAWKPVEHPHWQSLDDRLSELRAYRFDGKPCYEVRSLYAAPPAAAQGGQPGGGNG